MTDLGFRDRHPATLHLVSHLRSDDVEPRYRGVALATERMVIDALASLGDGPELSAGLRKLMEARECFNRQADDDFRARARSGG